MQDKYSQVQVFIGFAAEDRYEIAEPIVYHLKNYGINVWYDRHRLLMGHNRISKNLVEGVAKSEYAVLILSKDTSNSACAMEEISIIKTRFDQGEITVFPILYELSPNDILGDLCWIKDLIFKETNHQSGTREICNHIACKITEDFVIACQYRSIPEICLNHQNTLPASALAILDSYQHIDHNNLNSKVALLYATYLILKHSLSSRELSVPQMIQKIFERLFSETKLNLAIDYRELWLLENTICLLVQHYIDSCIESSI